ncbi:hypothetical protein Y032_0005g2662 [Ancylostoma ceylanicum]|uniref:Uncharacterized protein n=1 Tax=Ancylostoma ceylanicum TaxID=53326 RepID=A0A016VT26_9BILA|nr:hypothetical protein Y032_0005g2662 [Ancylostoma ceylanicum]
MMANAFVEQCFELMSPLNPNSSILKSEVCPDHRNSTAKVAAKKEPPASPMNLCSNAIFSQQNRGVTSTLTNEHIIR